MVRIVLLTTRVVLRAICFIQFVSTTEISNTCTNITFIVVQKFSIGFEERVFHYYVTIFGL